MVGAQTDTGLRTYLTTHLPNLLQYYYSSYIPITRRVVSAHIIIKFLSSPSVCPSLDDSGRTLHHHTRHQPHNHHATVDTHTLTTKSTKRTLFSLATPTTHLTRELDASWSQRAISGIHPSCISKNRIDHYYCTPPNYTTPKRHQYIADSRAKYLLQYNTW
ncbi:unnamed protein product, partial [Ectocarpus sp. 8 AP-2014]